MNNIIEVIKKVKQEYSSILLKNNFFLTFKYENIYFENNYYYVSSEESKTIFTKSVNNHLKDKHNILIIKEENKIISFDKEKDLINNFIKDSEIEFIQLYKKISKLEIINIENTEELIKELKLLIFNEKKYSLLNFKEELLYVYYLNGYIKYIKLHNYNYYNTNIESTLNKNEDLLKKARKTIKEKVIGQNLIIDEILDLLEMRKNNFFKVNEFLLGCVLFSGDTGTGKTELGKVLSEEFFLSEPLIIDCNTLTHPDLIANTLFGTGKGFVDSDLGGVFNNNSVKEKVIILDEIEKAHPSIFTIIMNVLDRGYAFDPKTNEKIIFKNTLIVITTNLIRNFIEKKEIQKHLISNGIPKEVLGRIDNFFFFNNHFTHEELTNISFKLFYETIQMFPNQLKGKEIKYFINKDKILNLIKTLIPEELNFGIRELRNKILKELEKKYYPLIQERLKDNINKIDIIFD